MRLLQVSKNKEKMAFYYLLYLVACILYFVLFFVIF